jgi:putative membrane protein
MNTNPLLPLNAVRSLGIVVGFAGVLVTSGGAATAVRDDRVVVPTARDVRVVEPVRPLKKIDRDFFEKAAKASMSEVQISRVAATRTTNPEVKRFAQMMIEDHESATEQLAALASTRGVSLPAKDPHPDKWEKRDAKNFDKEYLEKMVSDHEDVVKLFEKQSKNGDDPEAVAFARKLLPKMQEHLQHALDLKRTVTDKRDRR